MTIQQIIDIPDSHRLTIDVPREIPAGRAVLTFTPEEQSARRQKDRELEAAAALAAEDYRSDPELTAFCVLDGDDFHSAGQC
jgi:hypothetical protein